LVNENLAFDLGNFTITELNKDDFMRIQIN